MNVGSTVISLMGMFSYRPLWRSCKDFTMLQHFHCSTAKSSRSDLVTFCTFPSTSNLPHNLATVIYDGCSDPNSFFQCLCTSTICSTFQCHLRSHLHCSNCNCNAASFFYTGHYHFAEYTSTKCNAQLPSSIILTLQMPITLLLCLCVLLACTYTYF